MSGPAVYNMPSGVPFLENLAIGLRKHYGDSLSEGLILLPTRRAVRHMGDAFVTASMHEGVQASLLPRMRTLADIQPEEPPFEPGELLGQVAPAIDPMQRRFEMARLVAAYHDRAFGQESEKTLDAAAALSLAEPLLAILDDAALEEARLSETQGWQDLVDEAAKHFQDAATLYKIIQEFWPEHLAQLEMMEPQSRKVELLHRLCESWTQNPPDYPVIIAGSTGSLKATRKLMKCVANLPQGLVVLPGLQMDEDITVESWAQIDVQHPQYALKQVVETIGIERSSVRDWLKDMIGDVNGERPDMAELRARRHVLADALVPAGGTADWVGRIDDLQSEAGGDKIFDLATRNLSLIEARTQVEEALSIALIMRETLEPSSGDTPPRTAALITPDQQLARRVRARLARWDIHVDMSQGESLTETSMGVFLDMILKAAQNPDAPLEKSVIFSHPLCVLGRENGESLAQWQRVEKSVYRTDRRRETEPDGQSEIELALRAALEPLLSLNEQGQAGPQDWAEALSEVAEMLAEGAEVLWQGEDGHAAVLLLESILAHGEILPPVDMSGFASLLRHLMRAQTVRQRTAEMAGAHLHPRLSILGPLEARMLSADVIILGGLNEGIWPAASQVGPFLSRGMRQDMGLSLPERRYGLAAHDFFELAAKPSVFLSRSLRSDSGPTLASRWVWRLQTLLRGALGKEGMSARLGTGQKYLDWARQIDHVSADEVQAAPRPAPTPPVDKRWATRRGRGLSITEVKTLIRDPYSIYAKHVLRLKRLKNLHGGFGPSEFGPSEFGPSEFGPSEFGPSEFGTAIHLGLENFLTEYKPPFVPEQDAILVECLKSALATSGYDPAFIAKEKTRFFKIAKDLRVYFNDRLKAGFEIVGLEVDGQIDITGHDFTLRGKMDLVERRPDGYGFIDFKTGTPPSGDEVKAGFDPQLPLAAYILEQGGLKGYPKADAIGLGYVRVKGSGNDFKASQLKPPIEDLVTDSIHTLRKLITQFDQEDQAYIPHIRAKYKHKWSDFDLLSRRDEWGDFVGGSDD